MQVDRSALKLGTKPECLDLDAIVEALGNRARPEISWISQVFGCSIDVAERTVEGVTTHVGPVIELIENIRRTGREYYAQFPAPIELFAFARLLRPRTVVESGVSSGVSSAFLLLGITVNRLGSVHSIDFPVARQARGRNEPWAIPSGQSSGWAIPEVLKKHWDLRIGRSEDLLEPLLKETGTLDLYCHDSPVDARHFAFEMRSIRSHLRPGSLVVADNTDWEEFQDLASSVGATPIRRRKSTLGAFRVPGGRFAAKVQRTL